MATTQLHHPIELDEKYKPRPIRFLRLAELNDWRVKVYGISARQEQPDSKFTLAAEKLAQEQLPRPAMSKGRYGVGIVIAHEGRDGNYVLVSWWIEENLLQHHVYFSPATPHSHLSTFHRLGSSHACGNWPYSRSSSKPGLRRFSRIR
jgi:hypothetical protein